MKQYNLSQIMKEAHKIKKHIKLYSLSHGVKSWGDCLKLAWVNQKKQVAAENARKATKEAFANAAPSKRSSYDDLSIPASAYYNANSTGRFGSHFVND